VETTVPQRLLSASDFAEVVRLTPLISIDLILRNSNGDALLGVRNNEPAKGFYFVPGGRILKNERIADAFRRIILNETGVSADISQSTFKGVFEHIYDSNFANRSDFGTHYVVLAYQITQPFDDVRLDSQHSAFEWWDDERIRTSRVVHENTRAYFLND
jgi:colanic acid biosynthesis protein WcaH